MTATRIRETADGVLYRLSRPRWFDDQLGVSRMTDHLIVLDLQEDDGSFDCCRTHVMTANQHGEIARFDVLLGSAEITDPDAMIEAMGYKVINGEEL